MIHIFLKTIYGPISSVAANFWDYMCAGHATVRKRLMPDYAIDSLLYQVVNEMRQLRNQCQVQLTMSQYARNPYIQILQKHEIFKSSNDVGLIFPLTAGR